MLIPFLGDRRAIVFDAECSDLQFQNFFRAISAKSTSRQLSKLLYQSSVFFDRHIRIECNVRKPDCS